MATLEAALPYREHIVAVGPRLVGGAGTRRRSSAPCSTAPGPRGSSPSRTPARRAGRVRPRGARPPRTSGAIDHGVRCLEDPDLVERLVARAGPLTVCPLSNVKLAVVPDLAAHPLRRMLELGLCVTVNSDDPAYFGGYVAENYRATAAALGLTDDELRPARPQLVHRVVPRRRRRAPRHLAAVDAFAVADAGNRRRPGHEYRVRWRRAPGPA